MPERIFDQREFRKTLGQFATGVTVVTTNDKNGLPVGMTCSSFNSLSMDPPMVLWSIAKSAFGLAAFSQAQYFNVHVLCSDQDKVSNDFARSGHDKFKDIRFRKGLGGIPILDRYAALFECETTHQYDGGDHVIMVGTVIAFQHIKNNPLVFHGGNYTGIDSLI